MSTLTEQLRSLIVDHDRPIRRIVRDEYRNDPLGVKPRPGRFSDPVGRYSIAHGAESVVCCLWEAVLRDRFVGRKRRALPRSEIDNSVVVTLPPIKPLRLDDLRRDGCARIGAPTAVVHDSRWSASQALSAAVYAQFPDGDGFLYSSRYTGDDCVAIFDRAWPKLEKVGVVPLAEYMEVHEVLIDCDIVLTIPPA